MEILTSTETMVAGLAGATRSDFRLHLVKFTTNKAANVREAIIVLCLQ